MRLRVSVDNGPFRDVEIGADGVTVGNADHCHVLADALAAPCEWCRIDLTSAGPVVRQLTRHLQVRVNGASLRSSETPLVAGDIIEVEGARLMLVADRPARRPDRPPARRSSQRLSPASPESSGELTASRTDEFTLPDELMVTMELPSFGSDQPANLLDEGARLRVLKGSFGVDNIPLGDVPITLGKAADNTFVIRGDGYVSGHHCRVEPRDGGHYAVVDLGSRNGTIVARHRLAQRGEQVLHNGDVIQLGQTALAFEDMTSLPPWAGRARDYREPASPDGPPPSSSRRHPATTSSRSVGRAPEPRPSARISGIRPDRRTASASAAQHENPPAPQSRRTVAVASRRAGARSAPRGGKKEKSPLLFRDPDARCAEYERLLTSRPLWQRLISLIVRPEVPVDLQDIINELRDIGVSLVHMAASLDPVLRSAANARDAVAIQEVAAHIQEWRGENEPRFAEIDESVNSITDEVSGILEDPKARLGVDSMRGAMGAAQAGFAAMRALRLMLEDLNAVRTRLEELTHIAP